MALNNKLDFSHREFPMTEDNFNFIQSLAFNSTGITLSDHKKEMIYGRLSRRIRHLNLKNFDEYCAIINDVTGSEHNEFVNAITTNLTSFYRENHHFEFLKNTVIPELTKTNAVSRRVRIWSAGCSSGEEPYSISAVFNRHMNLKGWDFKILATDLDEGCLAKARQGIYPAERAENLNEEQLSSLFTGIHRKGKDDGLFSVKSSVKEKISFKRLNLMENWPMKGPFDVIFCRNVVIYFDKPTQRRLFERFANLLKPNGYLIIGHSESLNNVSDRFQLIGKTIYQRRDH